MTAKTALMVWLELKFEEFEKNGGQVILRDGTHRSRSDGVRCRPPAKRSLGYFQRRCDELLAQNVPREKILDLVGCSMKTLQHAVSRRAGKAWAQPRGKNQRRPMIGKMAGV